MTVTVETEDGYEVEAVYALYEIDGESTELSLDGTDGEYTFTMPAADVTVGAVIEPQQTFNIYPPERLDGGTVTVDKETAAEGETVTVTVEPDEGYVVEEVYVQYEIDGEETRLILEEVDENGNYTFTMPAADVTVEAVIEQQTFTVTWLDGDGNTVFEDTVAYGETPVYGGEEPTKTADQNYRYTFNGKWDPEIAEVTDTATYTAQFDSTQLYAVEVIDPENSPTMEADVTRAAEGDTVTVTVKADGYDIESILVSTEDDEFEAEGENGVYTFEMPASDVTVEASLSPILYYITALDPDIQNTMVQALDDNGDENNERYTDETITLRIMWPVEAVTLNSVTLSWDGGSETLTWDPDTLTWTGDTENLTYAGDSSSPNSNVNNFTFTMPPSNVTIETDFTVLYNITVNYDESNGGGDVNTGIVTPTVDGEPVSQASPGDKVVLDIQLYNGYTVNFITYYAGDDSFPIEPVDGEYFFEMPDMDVRVYVSLSGT